MRRTTICFSHGQESGPWGTKIEAMAHVARAEGWPVESLDYQGIADPQARVRVLLAWCNRQAVPPVLVGSSMGGFVALSAAASTEVKGLFLLAPALYVRGYREIMPRELPTCPTTIVHGWRDNLIPWRDSVQYASSRSARLLLVDGDHRLGGNLPEICTLFGQFLSELASALP